MKYIFTLLIFLSGIGIGFGQTTVLDFEEASTSTTFQYFGGTLEGVINNIIANPNASGINTSATVAEFIQGGDAPDWGGAFSNPNPTVPIDLLSAGQICIKFHRSNAGNVMLKLEQSSTGAGDWEQVRETTVVGDWEEICYDVTAASDANPDQTAAGNIYARMVLFFDFGTPGTGSDVLNYFDDVVIHPAVDCTTILDFEEAATSTDFQYFGSTLDGTLTSVIANPNATGINESANVVEYVKPAGAEVWAGAYANPAPSTIIDAISGGEICIDVHMDHIGNLALKLEQPSPGTENWVTTVENTVVGEWEQLCFDFDNPSLEDSNLPATGNTYGQIVLFFDFNVAGTAEDVTTYFDNIEVCSSGGATFGDVKFSVDMNDYIGSFTTVYVSGSFNGWTGDGNPLEDGDGNGVWEGTLNIPTGGHEYKFTLDNWAAQEEFSGLDECTVTDGPYTNRSLIVTGDAELPTYCFNSCYACGESVQITFELGMGDVVPDDDGGVYLAGGNNFESPGGRFQLSDPDGDLVYSITFERAAGFSSFYTFANGNCPDFSCKEDISGQDCAQPANFNDRWLPAVMQDTVIATCFAICSFNTDCEIVIGTEEPSFEETLAKVNPNPTGDNLFIELDNSVVEPTQITLYNMMGSVQQQVQLEKGITNHVLDLSTQSPGAYYLHIQSGNRYITKQIIKQ